MQPQEERRDQDRYQPSPTHQTRCKWLGVARSWSLLFHLPGLLVSILQSYNFLKPEKTSRKSGRHTKSKHPNKRAQQTKPFVHQSQPTLLAQRPRLQAGTSQCAAVASFGNESCGVLQRLIVPVFEAGRPEAVRRQGKQYWSLAWSHGCEASTIPEATTLDPNLQATQTRAQPFPLRT